MFLFDSSNLNWPFAKLFLTPFCCLTTWLKTVQNLCMILIRVQIWWPCWIILLSFWRSSLIALSSFYSSASGLLTIFEFLSFFHMSILHIMLVYHLMVIDELDIFAALKHFLLFYFMSCFLISMLARLYCLQFSIFLVALSLLICWSYCLSIWFLSCSLSGFWVVAVLPNSHLLPII